MSEPAPRVLLIGWDAADWKMINPLLEAGQMPHLERFISSGVMGNLASLTPMLSPILWTSIATGKHADKHQILGFAEPDGDSGRIRPVTSTSRRCEALWTILPRYGRRAGVIHWFASHPAEPVNGVVISDRFAPAVAPFDKPWPQVAGSVHPPELLEKACGLRIHPAATTPEFVESFVPALRTVAPGSDASVEHLRALLAQCATVHMAATWVLQEHPCDFLGVYYDAIDRIGHAFMEYHPPRLEHVSEGDFERYRHVMTGCYQYHDKMLGRLMQLAGDETTIILVSDHGFHSDHLRPRGSAKIKEGRPVAWHRPHGVLAIRGPGIRRDQRVYGASLLDIAPTVLWLMGVPIGRDMDGKPLTQIAEGIAPPTYVDTHEVSGGDTSVRDMSDDPWVVQQTLSQLAALGYIEGNDTDGIAMDRRRNLGQVYLSTGRARLAHEQFEQVLARRPEDKAARAGCMQALLAMGRLDECEALVKQVLSEKEDAPSANYHLGIIQFRRGRDQDALRYLRRAERADPRLPGLHCQIGQVYLRRRKWPDAARTFRKALRIDPESAEAHDGLGVAYRALKRPEEAVYHHMQSIGLRHFRPQTHINLGLALAETGQIDWAIRAFQVAIEQNPDNPFPHRCLVQLFRRGKGDARKAEEHRVQAMALQRKRQSNVAAARARTGESAPSK